MAERELLAAVVGDGEAWDAEEQHHDNPSLARLAFKVRPRLGRTLLQPQLQPAPQPPGLQSGEIGNDGAGGGDVVDTVAAAVRPGVRRLQGAWAGHEDKEEEEEEDGGREGDDGDGEAAAADGGLVDDGGNDDWQVVEEEEHEQDEEHDEEEDDDLLEDMRQELLLLLEQEEEERQRACECRASTSTSTSNHPPARQGAPPHWMNLRLSRVHAPPVLWVQHSTQVQQGGPTAPPS